MLCLDGVTRFGQLQRHVWWREGVQLLGDRGLNLPTWRRERTRW